MSKLKPYSAILFSFIGAAGYGLFVRLAFGNEAWSGLFGTISIGFLFFVPLALGALTIFFAPAQYQMSGLYVVFAPWAPCLIFAAIAAVFTWEAWICVVMALPIFLTMATLGGFGVFLFFKFRDRSGKSHVTMISLLLLAPFLITPFENQFPTEDSFRVVESQIEINAAPEIVWRNITRVPEIGETERRFSFFHLAGLPRPIYAALSYDGVGGIRRGQWEDGLAFIETISEWRPNEVYTMQMKADTGQVRSSPLPLQEIGGRYFDVVEGQYRIERVSQGKVILHFTSTHRLTTRFNFYGGLWTDFFMRDIQDHILGIIKERAEAGR
jgi:hypothetical protein